MKRFEIGDNLAEVIIAIILASAVTLILIFA